MAELSDNEKLLVRDTTAAKMLDMGRSTFWKAVGEKLLPQPVKIGGLTRWRVADLKAVDVAAVLAQMDEVKQLPKTVPLGPGVHHVYRHFDSKGRLLYVGISFSALQRLSGHKSGSEWFWTIARVEVTGYATRADAVLAERIIIRTERPLHNVVHSLRLVA